MTKQPYLKNESGHIMMYSLFAMAFMGIISGALFTWLNNQNKLARTNYVLDSAELVAQRLRSQLNNDLSWAQTIRHTSNDASLACLRSSTGDCCPVVNQRFRIYRQDNTLLYDPDLAFGDTARPGFNYQGQPCVGFDPANGNDSCPFRADIRFSGSTEGARPNCQNPKIEIALEHKAPNNQIAFNSNSPRLNRSAIRGANSGGFHIETGLSESECLAKGGVTEGERCVIQEHALELHCNSMQGIFDQARGSCILRMGLRELPTAMNEDACLSLPNAVIYKSGKCFVNDECPEGQFMVGTNPDGSLMCQAVATPASVPSCPPFQAADSLTVNPSSTSFNCIPFPLLPHPTLGCSVYTDFHLEYSASGTPYCWYNYRDCTSSIPYASSATASWTGAGWQCTLNSCGSGRVAFANMCVIQPTVVSARFVSSGGVTDITGAVGAVATAGGGTFNMGVNTDAAGHTYEIVLDLGSSGPINSINVYGSSTGCMNDNGTPNYVGAACGWVHNDNNFAFAFSNSPSGPFTYTPPSSIPNDCNNLSNGCTYNYASTPSARYVKVIVSSSCGGCVNNDYVDFIQVNQ